MPVAEAWKIRTLTNSKGRLHLTPLSLLVGIMTRRVNLSEVEIELWQQILKVVGAGILPTHLDGHKHVHILPGVSDIVIRLAQEFSIPSIRCPCETAPWITTSLPSRNPWTATAKQYLVGRTVSVFARRFRQKLAKAGLLSPAHFYGLSQTGFLDALSIQNILGDLPECASELMCHPGYLDADLAKTGTRLLAERETEVRALTAHEVKKLVADRGIQLISYRQLETYSPEREVGDREMTLGSTRIRPGSPQQGGRQDE
jgi:predicted glycoside hydrolase/deacetylase ChbG (UPF0249 family)